MGLQIKCEQQANNTVYFTLSGEIDGNTAPHLEAELARFFTITQGVITVDFGSVSYMDSTGLGVLVGTYKAMVANKSQLIITEVSERLFRLFSITGLDNIMTIIRQKKDGIVDDNKKR
ncbi:anti-sigma factor antagonist [Brochothrix campestris]|uniref:Anti-sigma factor antagonist n=1 Tax=Brochothrix campestris FSL F6-1037 TaxID=1265861 RepID=W7CKZ6_9LIST|nr:anti-sigma factor antagonist [Brochothrix campestris]EUJ40164.1 anti-anti-sigma factor (antagonist of RsbW) [Brochothrix campestris FSL F6-1037]